MVIGDWSSVIGWAMSAHSQPVEANVARGRVTRRRRHKGAESVLWRCFRCRDRVCWPGVGLAAARRPVSVDRVGDDAGVHGNRRARKPAAVCTETGRSARTASRRSKLFALLSSRLSHMRPVRRLRVVPSGLVTSDWGQGTGDWKLVIGDWRLGAKDWGLKVGTGGAGQPWSH